MINTVLYVVGIPLLIYVTARKLGRRFRFSGNKTLLIMACVLFSGSLFLQSPQIRGEDTEFFTHLFGGGVVTGMLWLYFKPVLKGRRWYMELLQLFVLVSTLGVANELYELFAYEVGLMTKPVTDTSWDLLANTLGAGLFYGTYRLVKYLKDLSLQR